MEEKKKAALSKKQKDIVLRALTDPKFRKKLATSPGEALGIKRVSPKMKTEISMILSAVRGIEAHIMTLADELLCLPPDGPCGIAMA